MLLRNSAATLCNTARSEIMKLHVLIRLVTTLMLVGFFIGHGIVCAGSKNNRRLIGGGCAYDEYPGKAVITKIKKTERSKRQVKVIGGPGYEGYEVLFRLGTSSKIKQPWARKELDREHSFQLANSWYVGGKYIAKYGLREGKEFECTLMVRTHGACSPIVFRFKKLDTIDYFETKK